MPAFQVAKNRYTPNTRLSGTLQAQMLRDYFLPTFGGGGLFAKPYKCVRLRTIDGRFGARILFLRNALQRLIARKRIMELKVIKTEEQYLSYIAEAKSLRDQQPAPHSPEADRFDLLCVLLESYELERFREEHADPVEAIRYVMQERGLRQKDLAPLLGGKNRASEILSGKRRLTLNMVRRLSESLNIPAEVLIRDTSLGRAEPQQHASY
jgi:HTH-type transcriptional regulator/antitoxin HigA